MHFCDVVRLGGHLGHAGGLPQCPFQQVTECEQACRTAVGRVDGGKVIRHFDAHAYRTEDYAGVRDFAAGCMRTYLILKEKAKRWNDHPGIQTILADIEETNRSEGLGDFNSLLSMEFDRKALASKGLQYEKLDQLTMDILFGVE